MFRKLLHLVRLLFGSPLEFADRISTLVEARLSAGPGDQGFYQAISAEDGEARLVRELGADFALYLGEVERSGLEEAISVRLAKVKGMCIPEIYDADRTLARWCYAITRVRKPKIVVETGVSHGITSAYILSALQANGAGRLFSIDLPPLGADSTIEVGCAVPDDLKSRWQLQLGTSRRLLPEVLRRQAPIDLFIHDSLHTLRTMDWEIRTASAALGAGGVLIADDIESNVAFRNWLNEGRGKEGFAVVTPGKESLMFGVSVLAG